MSILSYFQELVSLIKKFGDFAVYLANESSKPSLLTGGFAAVGGIFGGPVGAFFGGLMGSTINYFLPDDLTAAIDILNGFSFIQKEEIVLGVQAIVGCALVASLIAFMADEKKRLRIYRFLGRFF